MLDDTFNRTAYYPTEQLGLSGLYGNVSSDRDVKGVSEESSPPVPLVRNEILSGFEFQIDGHGYHLTRPLRVSIESYPEGEHVVYLMLDRSILGYGQMVEEARGEMLEMLANDYLFYTSKSPEELTQDALELKQKLQGLFAKHDAH